jgi:hypothetical protein
MLKILKRRRPRRSGVKWRGGSRSRVQTAGRRDTTAGGLLSHAAQPALACKQILSHSGRQAASLSFEERSTRRFYTRRESESARLPSSEAAHLQRSLVVGFRDNPAQTGPTEAPERLQDLRRLPIAITPSLLSRSVGFRLPDAMCSPYKRNRVVFLLRILRSTLCARKRKDLLQQPYSPTKDFVLLVPWRPPSSVPKRQVVRPPGHHRPPAGPRCPIKTRFSNFFVRHSGSWVRQMMWHFPRGWWP